MPGSCRVAPHVPSLCSSLHWGPLLLDLHWISFHCHTRAEYTFLFYGRNELPMLVLFQWNIASLKNSHVPYSWTFPLLKHRVLEEEAQWLAGVTRVHRERVQCGNSFPSNTKCHQHTTAPKGQGTRRSTITFHSPDTWKTQWVSKDQGVKFFCLVVLCFVLFVFFLNRDKQTVFRKHPSSQHKQLGMSI